MDDRMVDEIDDIFMLDYCPACGEPMDYCQGHGPIGDPRGHAILLAHDEGDHRNCNWASDCVSPPRHREH